MIISDGGDNHSRYKEREIRELVRESDVLIYAIGIYEPRDLLDRTPEELAGPALLKELAESTGGREFSVGLMGEFSEITRVIGNALRSQYVLGFSPADREGDGRYHNVKVKIVHNHGLPPVVSWRLGYYASSDESEPDWLIFQTVRRSTSMVYCGLPDVRLGEKVSVRLSEITRWNSRHGPHPCTLSPRP